MATKNDNSVNWTLGLTEHQGCQMVYFQTKNQNLGNFLGSCNGRCCIFMNNWSILQPFGKLYGHLVQFVVIWYISPRFWYVVPRKIWQPCRARDPDISDASQLIIGGVNALVPDDMSRP
jgi:hypothetical protein